MFKAIFRTALLAVTLLAGTSVVAQTSDPVSTITSSVTGQCLTIGPTLTLAACDGLPHQNFSFGRSGAIYNSAGPTLTGVAGALCLNGSFPPGANIGTDPGNISFGPCVTLNGYWWLVGNRLHRAGSTYCLSEEGGRVQLEICNIANPNINWTIGTDVAADWPFTGATEMYNGLCMQALGAQTGTYSAGTPLGFDNCQQYTNEYFTFKPDGTITLFNQCLTDNGSGNAGDSITLTACKSTAPQLWSRVGNSVVSYQGNLCIGSAGNEAPGVNAQLQVCNSADANQQFSLNNVASVWPSTTPVPRTIVSGTTLTNAQVSAIVDWIQAETSISTTPFCYKAASYDRGVGTLPVCGEGQQLDAGLCYPQCREGFHGIGPVCYTDKTLFYNPGYHCTASLPDWLGGGCIATSLNSCRDGYAADPLQVIGCFYTGLASYGRGVGTVPTSCPGAQFQAGLCYANPRPGYNCTVTLCLPVCASGTVDCGAACASDAGQCAANIADMVISAADVLAFIGSGGASGAAKTAVTAAEAAYKLAKDANALAQAELNLQADVEAFMVQASKDLASMSTDEVQSAVAETYGPVGSPNYNSIAREWGARLLLASIQQLVLDVSTIVSTTLDPTGVVATINAFEKPICTQHTPIPKF